MPRKPEQIVEPIDAKFDDVAKAVASAPALKSPPVALTGKGGRISEADLWIPALRVANSYQGGFISTQNLILELEAIFNPIGLDADILEGRADTRFSQMVRNLVSHRKSNFIANGYAEYDDRHKGIQITIKGRTFLDDIQGHE